MDKAKRKLAEQLAAKLMPKDNRTEAQKWGGKGQILNERPEGMRFEEYKLLRRMQTKAIKKMLR
jgi:hypothetical protein